MKLPNASDAYVDIEKVTDYRLSLEHPYGWPKALFFRRLGFHESTAGQLLEGLRTIARMGQVTETIETTFGTKYIVDGMLNTPRGRRIPLTTIWIVETKREAPRFVTAYPRQANPRQS